MKSITRLAAIFLAVMPIAFSACVKDNCSRVHTYSYFTPVYKTKEQVRSEIRSHAAREVVSPGKLYLWGNFIFLNDRDKGVHIIDNSNPSAPRNVSFIPIPGNLDLAVKGNTLYADLYTDLVTIDIGNPSDVVLKKVTENVFPYRYYGGGFINNNASAIITDWVRTDTTIRDDCNDLRFEMTADVFLVGNSTTGSLATGAVSPVGQGGSMARFTIIQNRLYTVSNQDLDVFDISNSTDPTATNSVHVGMDIETIYPFRDKLFIGSTTGMYIYDVSSPDNPASAGQFNHVQSCDPVIADSRYAYVTLRSGTPCRGLVNELDILDLGNLNNPSLLKVYAMENPHGLSKDDNLLFICDGRGGLKIYDATDAQNLSLVNRVSGIETYDVIARNNVALVVATDGLYQYDYTNISNLRLLSKFAVNH